MVTEAFPNILSQITLYMPLEGTFLLLIVSVVIVWFLPNTSELMSDFKPVLNALNVRNSHFLQNLRWKPSLLWFVFIALVAVFCLDDLDNVREFLYYQF